MYKTKTIILLLVLFALPLQAISVDEILKNHADKLTTPSLQATLKVQLIAQNGDVREIEARAYQKIIDSNENNRLFIFDFPPTVRGTGLLIHSYLDGRDNNMWIYLPAIRRVKRISLESSGGGYFMGSDFTYRDLISNDYNKMELELIGEKVIDDIDYHVVKAWGQTPEIQQDNGYSYILSYHRKDNDFLMRREYFDFNDNLLKIYQVEKILEFDNYIYPTQISMENVQSGHRSLLVATDVITDDIPDRYFTTRYLQNN